MYKDHNKIDLVKLMKTKIRTIKKIKFKDPKVVKLDIIINNNYN